MTKHIFTVTIEGPGGATIHRLTTVDAHTATLLAVTERFIEQQPTVKANYTAVIDDGGPITESRISLEPRPCGYFLSVHTFNDEELDSITEITVDRVA